MKDIVEEIRSELIKNADEKTRLSGERYFKEPVKIFGLNSARVKMIAGELYKKLSAGNKGFVLDICEELWRSGYLEETFIACSWSYNIRKEYVPEDFRVFERWVNNYVNNWASCDTLCNHTIGTFIEMYPSFLAELKKWALSDNRWVKRAAAVTLIVPARKGKFLSDIFEIADILHSDRDDMVQKGYGWMLKVASQAHQQKVFSYIMKKKAIMPRTALRYAIEKMPADMKAKAMEK